MFFDENPHKNEFIDKIHKFGIFQHSILKKEIDIKKLEFVHNVNQDDLRRLEMLRENLKIEQNKNLFQAGNYWWKLPYEDVRDYLLYDLNIEDSSDDWKYERKWITVGEKNKKSILLYEVGHLSRFDTSNYYNYEQISKYSDVEQAEMVKKFNKDLDKYAMLDIMSHGNNPVVLESTGQIYDSRLDYYLSLDYMSDRMFYNSVYKRSLYVEHISEGLTAKSNSLHYESIYKVCDIVVNNGELVYAKDSEAQFLKGKGDIDDRVKTRYSRKDHEILVAAAISQCEEVKTIPIKLFDNTMENKADSYDMAMHQAEIFSCLAKKMVL